jgi:hypothetical protein
MIRNRLTQSGLSAHFFLENFARILLFPAGHATHAYIQLVQLNFESTFAVIQRIIYHGSFYFINLG